MVYWPTASVANTQENTTDENARYNVATIRRLLRAAFTPDTLRRFCQERAEFQQLLDEFSPAHGLAEMADRAIVYCRTQWLRDELLTAIQAENPRQYARFEPRLALDDPPADVLREGKLHWDKALEV